MLSIWTLPPIALASAIQALIILGFSIDNFDHRREFTPLSLKIRGRVVCSFYKTK